MNAESTTQQDQSLRTLPGRVVSDRMDKTVTVLVERSTQHPLYGKYIRRSTKIHAHDEGNEYREGDLVRIASCRPLSKSKSWTVVELVERPAKAADLNEEAVNAGVEVEQ